MPASSKACCLNRCTGPPNIIHSAPQARDPGTVNNVNNWWHHRTKPLGFYHDSGRNPQILSRLRPLRRIRSSLSNSIHTGNFIHRPVRRILSWKKRLLNKSWEVNSIHPQCHPHPQKKLKTKKGGFWQSNTNAIMPLIIPTKGQSWLITPSGFKS